jgi:hypothetical protein
MLPDAPAVAVPLVQVVLPPALTTLASDVLFPKLYSTKLWLMLPAPLFVDA